SGAASTPRSRSRPRSPVTTRGPWSISISERARERPPAEALAVAGGDDIVLPGPGGSSLQDRSCRRALRRRGLDPVGASRADSSSNTRIAVWITETSRVPARRRRDGHHAQYQWL